MSSSMHSALQKFSKSHVITMVALLSMTGCATIESGSFNGQVEAHQQSATARPTDGFRAHHAEIVVHLGHLDHMALSLLDQSPAEQRQTMNRMTAFLSEHIAAHAAEEERVLYPVVERQAGNRTRLTEVPIYEHRIIERGIANLKSQAASESLDVRAFMRDALHLVGLIRAHFEVEEQVLLPVLDKTMSHEEFQREVGEKMSHH